MSTPRIRYPGGWAPPGHNSWGWDHRWAWQVVVSVLCVHAVLLANYMHLQYTQRVQHTSQLARVARLVIFFFMPTIVLAELIVNLTRTFIVFLAVDPNDLSLRKIFSDSKRYVCGIAGMHVVPPPAFDSDEDIEQSSNAQEGSSTRPDPHLDQPARPHLSVVRDPNDLQHHKVAWSFTAVLRIALLLLAIVQSIGTILLWSRRVGLHWHWPLGFDKRNFVAAISSIGCSLASIVLIVNRSEWSLKPLTISATRPKEYVVRTFALELVIASILNETPFLDTYYVVPISWFRSLEPIFGPGRLVLFVCLGLAVWFGIFAFNDRVKERLPKVNWEFVIALPVVALLLWILVDVVVYLVEDVLQLAGAGSRYSDAGIWDADPWAKYIPFC